jgi:regulator of replication initiation timing
MNYELLNKLAMEENGKLKSEKLFLAKRNDILHIEIEILKKMIRELQEEKTFLESEVESLKSVLTFKKEQDSYDIPQYS